jgi:hypothetical protein
VFATPTNNDFLDLVDWHLSKARERASGEIAEIRSKAAAAGVFQSSRTGVLSIAAARREFEAGITTVLGELKRVLRITDLDRDNLRQLTTSRLVQFAASIKAISGAGQFRDLGIGQYIDEQFTAMDKHLLFAMRQFDVGFFDPQEPEVPQVSNSITIGSMTAGAIQQGSPGAKQTVQLTVNVDAISNALTQFQSAIESVALPPKTIETLMADVQTIRAQLAKPSPSTVILHEAGKSLRNVIEGITGGLLTPAVVTAAAALWSALGFG